MSYLAETRSAAWRATFISLMSLTMAIATVAMAIVSVLAPFLVRDLDLSRSQVGLLVTAVTAGGAITSLVAGRMTDRVGGRAMAAAIFVIGIVVFAGMAAANTFLWAFAVAAMCGFSNGAANPTTNTLIAAHYPPGARGLVMGIKQSGVQAGLFVAGIVLPPAALVIGWRPTLLIGAALPAAALVALLWYVPGDRPTLLSDAALPGRKYRASHMVRWMTLYGTLMGAGGATIVSFLPLYAQEGLGFSVAAAGLAASLFGLLGVVGRVLWARKSERLRTFALPLGIMALMSTASSILLLSAMTGPPWLLWVGTVVAGSSVASWNAVGMLAIVARERPEVMGRASGLVNFGFLGGMSVTPIAFGWLVDRTGSYQTGWGFVVVLFAGATLTTVAWHKASNEPAPPSEPSSTSP